MVVDINYYYCMKNNTVPLTVIIIPPLYKATNGFNK